MNDLTCILHFIQHGDPKAADELRPLIYRELHSLSATRLTQESPGQAHRLTALGVSERTVLRHWAHPKVWLYQRIRGDGQFDKTGK